MVNCFHGAQHHSDSLSLLYPLFFPGFHLVDFFKNNITYLIASLRTVYLNFVCALLPTPILSHISFTTFLFSLSPSSLASFLPSQQVWNNLSGVGEVFQTHMVRSHGHKSQTFWRARGRVLQIVKGSSRKVKVPLLVIPLHAKEFTSQFVWHQTLALRILSPLCLWLSSQVPWCVNANAAFEPTNGFAAKRWNWTIHQNRWEPFLAFIHLPYPFYA